MPLALAFEDAKTNQFRNEGDVSKGTKGGNIHIPFFGHAPFIGSRDDRHFPDCWAALAQWDPGRVSRAHFHTCDQFQVIVDGKGKLGRHDLTPYGVHFSRAYTPYGPLIADAGTGLTFFVLRAHWDPGSQRLPEKRDQLKQVADRQPWQITRPVIFPALEAGTAAAASKLQAIPDIRDEHGLAAYTLSMKANAKAYSPEPSHGDGQYLVVVSGSLLHNRKEHKTWALVFTEPKEGPFPIQAGPQGLEALILNFPVRNPRTIEIKVTSAAAGFKKWQCELCAFVYDEAVGLPSDGIPAGTRWDDVPHTWSCPDCSASKSDFQMVEA